MWPLIVRLAALAVISHVAEKSSGANVSKLMPENKMSSNVISDTALFGLVVKLHTGTRTSKLPTR
jgi:hypothetical protein